MTTDQTTIPAPAWLNIDEVCPPEVRAEMAEMATEAEAMLTQLEEMARRSFLLLRKADDLEPDSVDMSGMTDMFGHKVRDIDTPYELFAAVTGSDRLRTTFYRLAEMAMAGADDPHSGRAPEWWSTPNGLRPEDIDEARRQRREAVEEDAVA